MTEVPSRLRRGVAGAAALFSFALPADAHPHACVTWEATVLYSNGAFAGLDYAWTFDQSYTDMAIEGLDKNNDGVYDRSELAELAKVNVESLKDLDYFTYPMLAGQPLKLGEPREYWLEHKGGLLSLHFKLPFAEPVRADAKGFTFSVMDRTIYIAFNPAKGVESVRLGPGAPKSCRIKIDEPDAGDTGGMGGYMSAIGCAVTDERKISVECGP